MMVAKSNIIMAMRMNAISTHKNLVCSKNIKNNNSEKFGKRESTLIEEKTLKN